MKTVILLPFFLFIIQDVHAQLESDSIQVVTTLEEMFTVCNSSSPEINGSDVIIFDRLAPYLSYCCEDESRKGKEAFDYNKADDRRQVDEIGNKIKNWLESFDSYSVKKYMTQAKKDGTVWYGLVIEFKNKNTNEEKVFAFLKIGGSFLLGDID